MHKTPTINNKCIHQQNIMHRNTQHPMQHVKNEATLSKLNYVHIKHVLTIFFLNQMSQHWVRKSELKWSSHSNFVAHIESEPSWLIFLWYLSSQSQLDSNLCHIVWSRIKSGSSGNESESSQSRKLESSTTLITINDILGHCSKVVTYMASTTK